MFTPTEYKEKAALSGCNKVERVSPLLDKANGLLATTEHLQDKLVGLVNNMESVLTFRPELYAPEPPLPGKEAPEQVSPVEALLLEHYNQIKRLERFIDQINDALRA